MWLILFPKTQLNPTNFSIALANALERANLQKQVADQQRAIYEMSIKDDLTGLFNKRFFIDRLTAEINRSLRHQMDLCLLDDGLGG